MKTSLIFIALAASALAFPPAEVPMTAERLLQLQKVAPFARLDQPADDAARPAQAPERSILSQSVILHDGTHWTLVPSGAVIHLPAGLRGLVGAKAVGQLLTWPEFLAKNLSWISTTEVAFEEAAGTRALPPERVKLWTKHDKVIVAVHQGGPISVRLPAETQNLTQR